MSDSLGQAAHPVECIAYCSCQVCRGVPVCAGPDGDEAEYAWLSANNLKPFRQGDSQMMDPAMTGNDPSLRECILAAEHNVTDFLARAAAREKARTEQQEVALDEADSEAATDSDGGEALMPLPLACLSCKLPTGLDCDGGEPPNVATF